MKKLLVFATVVVAFSVVGVGKTQAASEGHFANTASSSDWTNPDNIIGMPDDACASTSASGLQIIDATNFGFSLPGDATISAITVSAKVGRSNTGPRNFNYRLITGGVPGGDTAVASASAGVAFTSLCSETTFASVTSTSWGFASLSPANINSSDFGVRISASGGATTTRLIDGVSLSVDFTVPVGSISGSKFNDINENGVWDHATEPGVANWRMNLTDTDDVILDTQLTTSSGSYSFIDLVSNTYRVHELEAVDWTRTMPASSSYYEVVIASSSASIGNDFGNHADEAEINGMKFNDLNNDGIKDQTEPGLEGWHIRLIDSNQAVTAEATTNASGSFQFTGIWFGEYTLSEVPQTGWTQTHPASGSYPINVVASHQIFYFKDFGNHPTPTPPPSGGGGGGSVVPPEFLNTPTPTPVVIPTPIPTSVPAPTSTSAPVATPAPTTPATGSTTSTPTAGIVAGAQTTTPSPSVTSSPTTSPFPPKPDSDSSLLANIGDLLTFDNGLWSWLFWILLLLIIGYLLYRWYKNREKQR